MLQTYRKESMYFCQRGAMTFNGIEARHILFETPYLATQVSWPLGIYKLVWSRMCKVGPRRTECDP